MSSYQAEGRQLRMYLEPGAGPHTFDSSSLSFPIVSESVRKQGTILYGNGLRGTRAQHVSSSRQGPYTVSGTVNVNPTPNMLDFLLTYMTGDTESTDVWSMDSSAETLPEFGLLFDRENGTFEYTSCKIGRWNLSGRASGLLELSLDIVGKTEATGTSVPDVDLGTDTVLDAPYQFADCVFTLASGTRLFNQFAFSVDHAVQPDNFNSLTANHLRETDRVVRFGGDAKFGSAELAALYGTANSGAAASVVATNGNASLTIAMTALQLPDRSPVMSGPGASFLPVVGEVRDSSDTGYEARFTNDVTLGS